jgi:hypothetical protein
MLCVGQGVEGKKMCYVNRRGQEEAGTYLYVVLLVTRTHHAVVYEIPTAAAPENAIAKSRKLRVSSGLNDWLADTDHDSCPLQLSACPILYHDYSHFFPCAFGAGKHPQRNKNRRKTRMEQSTHKFRTRFALLQSSAMIEKIASTGIESRLL